MIIFKSFAQTTSDNITLQQELFTKSQKQNTLGWITFSGGALMTIIGLYMDPDYNYDTSQIQTNDALGFGGLAVMGVGIHFFARSGTNARNSAKLGLQYQSLNTPIPMINTSRNIPALSLKIPL